MGGTWPHARWAPVVSSFPCRALLGRLGGIFLPSRTGQTPSDQDEGLPGAVLAAVGPVLAFLGCWE